MIKKDIFINRYLEIIKKLLYESLPEEDILQDMCEEANEIVHTYIKKG